MLLGGWRFTIAGFIILLVLFLKRGVKYVLPSIDHNSYKGFIFVATSVYYKRLEQWDYYI